MKKIVLAAVFFAISLLSFAQNNYYWSGNKKHYLKEDPNVFIVKFTGTTKNIVQNVQTLRNKKEIRYVAPIKDNLGIIIAGGGYPADGGKA